MILLRIACSARFGSNARRLGKSGSVDSVTAAAVAEVRAVGEHALRQALKLVRANRSIASFVETTRRRGDGVSNLLVHQRLRFWGEAAEPPR